MRRLFSISKEVLEAVEVSSLHEKVIPHASRDSPQVFVFLLYMRRLFRQKGQAVLKRQVSSLHEKVILLRIAETSYAANFFSA